MNIHTETMSNEELLKQFIEDARMNETKLPSGLVISNKPKELEFNHNIDLCSDCLEMVTRLVGSDFEELTIGGPVFPCLCKLCGKKTIDLHTIRKSGIVNAMRKMC